MKDVVDFHNFIRNDVAESGKKSSFNLGVRNVKQEIINSYR